MKHLDPRQPCQPSLASGLRALALATCLMVATALPAQAHRGGASDASGLSLLPVASLVAAPLALLSGAALLTVVTVHASADGAVWLLENSADGARATLRLSAQAAGGVSVLAGTSVLVTAVAAGWMLSVAGQAVAFVPNAIGASLLYNEQVTR